MLKQERQKREALEDTVEEMREMMKDMKARYDAEIRLLKSRVDNAESKQGPYQG